MTLQAVVPKLLAPLGPGVGWSPLQERPADRDQIGLLRRLDCDLALLPADIVKTANWRGRETTSRSLADETLTPLHAEGCSSSRRVMYFRFE